MGEVYRARDTKLNRDVALKIVPHLAAADPGQLTHVAREAQLLASLNHQNIRSRARDLCQARNATRASQQWERRRILSDVFGGGASVWMHGSAEAPCDAAPHRLDTSPVVILNPGASADPPLIPEEVKVRDMVRDWFLVHDGLIGAARLPSRAAAQRRVSAAEILVLLACGAAAAAAVGFAKLGLRIPGHSILLAALPMALGLSLTPRRLAGSVMSAGALGSALSLTAAGASYGSGAIVSLCLLGPMMDLALRRARRGSLVYLALVLSGVATNLLALGSRAAFKVLGLDIGARPFDSWWLQAVVTYTLSGVVAGMLGALCWFHFSDRSPERRTQA